MSESLFVIVSYDILDDKRRLKVARVLLDHGGQRVQRSVFECYITLRNLDQLRDRLRKVIAQEEDSVRFYRLCGACQFLVGRLGVAEPIDAPGLRIV
jgi:CRISPR-associated protein Cas2